MNVRKVQASVLGLAVALACANTGTTEGSSASFTPPVIQQPPAVIVLLVVDQLGADLLERYEDVYTGGLARLLTEGRRFVDATHDHGITETSPGHASLSTGTYPSRHGMVSNIWYTRTDVSGWQPTENVIDPEVMLVGAEQYVGSSPSVLMRSGLADWLVAHDGDARVVSVSGKDRAAILLAGQGGGEVYWFEPQLARFATSTHYREENPDWIEEFNRSLQDRIEDERTWSLEVPRRLHDRTRPDTAAFERDGVDTYFPHVFQAPDESGDDAFHYWWSNTPYLDREVLALARVAIDEMDLGEDEATDLLAISLSATDRVGHDFGPHSREQLDNLLRLDEELGRFLDDLDRRFQDRYLLVFSSDHGVSPVPEYMAESGLRARRLTRDAGVALNERAGAILRSSGSDGDAALAEALAAEVVSADWIAGAWAGSRLAEAARTDSIAALVGQSVFPGRAAGLMSRLGVEMVLEPHTLLWVIPSGTTHGSPYLYDRRVPLIFAGAGVAGGQVSGHAATVSVAATLAQAAGIEFPADLDGSPLPLR